MEDMLYEVESVRRFVGLKLSGPLPDETTILNFRHLLEEHELGQSLFEEINSHLESQGLRLREGTIVDASIIEAPSSTKNRARERDSEMRQTKKGNEWHFGMKVHIGADAETGVVHSVRTTPANVHDVTEAHRLLHGGEKRVWGDAGYQGVDKRLENRKLDVEWQVAMRPGRRRRLDSHRTIMGTWVQSLSQIYLIDVKGSVATASVDRVTAPSGSRAPGEHVDVAVTFTDPVSVTGSPRLKLSLGGGQYASFRSVSGNAVNFRYTVQAGDHSQDLGYNHTSALVLNGGAIDASLFNEGPVDLTLPALNSPNSLAGSSDVVVDGSPPPPGFSVVNGKAREGQAVPLLICHPTPDERAARGWLTLTNVTAAKGADFLSRTGGSSAYQDITGEPTVNSTFESLVRESGGSRPVPREFYHQGKAFCHNIHVAALDDNAEEGDETFTATVRITLNDNDPDQPDPELLPSTVITGTIDDADDYGVWINEGDGLVTDESGATDTFTVRLDKRPNTGAVLVQLIYDDRSEISLSGGGGDHGGVDGCNRCWELGFNRNNWNSPKTVTVTGKSDGIYDGDVSVPIHVKTFSGSTPGYAGSDTAWTVPPGKEWLTFKALNKDDSAPLWRYEDIPTQAWGVGSPITPLTLPEVSGGNGALGYTVSPALPAGLSFNDATRTISGTRSAGSQLPESYTVTVRDGDSNTAASDSSAITFVVRHDVTPPKITSISRHAPTAEKTNANTLVWQVVFNENVRNVNTADFNVTGTDGDATGFTGSGATYLITVGGGDLNGYNGEVALVLDSETDIEDEAGIDLDHTLPTSAENYQKYDMDNVSPIAVITPSNTIGSPFTATITFNKDVTGFAAGEITSTGATLSSFSETDARTYTVLVTKTTPDAAGVVVLSIAANVATDSSGNGNLAATKTINYNPPDTTAPTMVITPSNTSASSFTATFTFSEDVTGFAVGDITITGGAPSNFSEIDARTYTVRVAKTNPNAVGSVVLSIAANVATDSSSNGNTAASQTITYIPGSAPGPPVVTEVTPAIGQLTVKWEAPEKTGGSAIGHYNLQYKLSSGSEWTAVNNRPAAPLEYHIGKLLKRQYYDVRVQAVNATNNGQWSATFAVATLTDDSISLVGNVRQETYPYPGWYKHMDSVNLPGGWQYGGFGQAFSTGPFVGGYRLKSIGIRLHDVNDISNVIMTVETDGGGNRPSGTVVHTMNPPALPEGGGAVNVYSAPAGATLQPDTTYFVVVRYTGNLGYGDGGPAVRILTANDEDEGGAPGWSIADGYAYYTGFHLWRSGGYYRGLMIEVMGTATVISGLSNTEAPENTEWSAQASASNATGAVTWTLESADAHEFKIDSSTGKLDFAAHNYEDPADSDTNNSYQVTVWATDSATPTPNTDAKSITVTVIDVNEKPGKPLALEVRPGDVAGSLKLFWGVPPDMGKSPLIEEYNVRYRQQGVGEFTDAESVSVSNQETGVGTTLTGLTAGTSYEVQVQAKTHEGESDWSESGVGETPAHGLVINTAGGGIRTTEDGGTDAFTVRLATKPLGVVQLDFTLDSTEGALSGGNGFTACSATCWAIRFTEDNWNTPRPITVTGVDDDDADGDVEYQIAIKVWSGSDPGYANLTPDGTPVTNVDDDSGLTITPSTLGELNEEAPGNSGTFTVALDIVPDFNVTVDVTVDSGGDVTIDPSSLVFTPATWNDPQTVTVTAVDDAIEEVAEDFAISVKVGGGVAEEVTGSVAASDQPPPPAPGLNIEAGDGIRTSEDGATTDTFTVVLNVQPLGDVQLDFTPDATEGALSGGNGFTACAGSCWAIRFTQNDWDTPRTITVSGLDDSVDDGNVSYEIAVKVWSGSDSGYATLTPDGIPVTNEDDDGVTIAKPGKPDAPGVTPGDSELRVTWTEPDNDGPAIVAYDLRHSTDGSDWTVVSNVWTNDYPNLPLSHTIPSLQNGQSYEVQVRARNSGGPGHWSESRTGTPAASTPSATVPGTPAAPTVTPGNGQLTVEWEAPASNGSDIEGYQVRYILSSADESDDDNWTVRNAGNNKSYVIASLTNGESYDVQVLATNGVGDSLWSPTATGAPVAPPPSATAPDAPVITGVTPGNGQLAITWNAPTSDGGAAIMSYTLRHKPTSGSIWTQVSKGPNDRSHTIGNLANGTQYDVEVLATNGVDDSGWSSTSTGTPRTTPSAPAAPTVTPGNATLSVTWTAPNTGGSVITGYDVRYILTSATDKADANWTDANDSGTDTTHTIASLTNGESYDVQVRAQNVAGNGGWSTTTTGTPVAPSQPVTVPDAPVGLVLTPGDLRLTMEWMPPSDDGGAPITAYDLQYRPEMFRTFPGYWDTSEVAGVSESGDTVSHFIGSDRNGEFDVRVRAVNSEGAGPWTEIVTGAMAEEADLLGAPAITGVTAGDSKLTVTWTVPSNDGGAAVTAYDVRYSTDGSDWKTLRNIWADGDGALSYAITDLAGGTQYQVQVRALNSKGASVWSASSTGTPDL